MIAGAIGFVLGAIVGWVVCIMATNHADVKWRNSTPTHCTHWENIGGYAECVLPYNHLGDHKMVYRRDQNAQS